MIIYFVAKAPDATSYYRTELPAKALRSVGHQVDIDYLENVKPERLARADIIVVQRPTTNEAFDLVRKIKAAYPKKPVIGDYDDDYYSVPKWNPGYPHLKSKESTWRKIVREFDGIMVSTPPLVEAFRKNNRYSGPMAVIQNGFDFDTFDALGQAPDFRIDAVKIDPEDSRKLLAGYSLNNQQFNMLMEDKPVIAWAGSRFHYLDLEWVAREMKDICDSIPEVVFLFVGYIQHGLVKDLPISRVFACGGAFPTPKFYEMLKSLKIDIALAPLHPVDFNSSKCVGPDTMVITGNGASRIADIVTHRKDDSISSLVGTVFTSHGMKPFDGSYYGATQKCLKIKTSSGYEIVGTPSHRLKVGGEWVHMSDISIGHVVDMSPVNWPDIPEVEVPYPIFMHKLISESSLKTFSLENAPRVRVNEDWGRFLGYLVGDGTVNGYNRVGISCSTDYPDIIDDVMRLFMSFGLCPKIVEKKDKRVLNDDGHVKIGKGRDVVAPSRIFRRLIEHMGFAGSKGKLLTVPDVILRSPLPVIREFLRGLFESDSSISKSCSITFVTKSKRLACQVQFLLSGFGIKAAIRSQMNAAQHWTVKREYFGVVLGSKSARIFHEKIGFISDGKSSRLADRVARARSNAYQDWDWTDTVEEIDTVDSEVFDICVPDGRHYIANNFVSHNSNLKVMEAMALGAYPICSDLEPYDDDIGVPSVADDYDEDLGYGILVPHEDKPGAWKRAIADGLDVLSDPAMRAAMVKHNSTYVRRRHDISTRANDYASFFKAMLEAKS